jgi:sulfate permease, SulP family
LMVGAWQLLLGLARAGKLVDYISHTVIVGFTAGAAVLIINSQIGNFFGLAIPRGLSVAETISQFATRFASIDALTTSTALFTLIVAIAWRPLNRWVPAMLVAVVAGSAYAAAMKAFDSSLSLATVDALPGALPPLSMPSIDLETLKLLLIPSIAMTLLALTEAVSISQALARRRGESIDGNREFLGQGLANVAGSFFSSYPSSGSFNRSGVNVGAGAVTPFSAISAAVFLVLILFFVAPWAKYLPLAAVAAILMLVAVGLVDRREIAHLLRDRRERITLIATFVATLTLPLEWAVLFGVATSVVVSKFSRRA